MRTAIDALLLLLAGTESRIGQMVASGMLDRDAKELQALLKDFTRRRLTPLFHRQASADRPRYVLGLVGLTNVGKSTLVEALLEHPVAPRLNGPATSIPVEYEYSAEWGIQTMLRREPRTVSERYTSPSSLAEALRLQVLGLTCEQAHGIRRVVVSGPMALLQDGLVLADTPGFGAGQANVGQESRQAPNDDRGNGVPEESAGAEGTERLSDGLDYTRHHANEICFCISGADMVVKREETRTFEALREKCMTVVVTKWDFASSTAERDIHEYRARYAHLFPMCDLLFIHARAGAGVHTLRDLIRQRATPASRRALLQSAAKAAWNDINTLAGEHLRKLRIDAMPWRQDALERLRVVARHEGLALEGL